MGNQITKIFESRQGAQRKIRLLTYKLSHTDENLLILIALRYKLVPPTELYIHFLRAEVLPNISSMILHTCSST